MMSIEKGVKRMSSEVWITEESDKELWIRLKAIWEGERRPKYVVQRAGGDMYEVFTIDDEVKFLYKESRKYYDSTGF